MREKNDYLIIGFDAGKAAIVCYDEDYGPYHLKTIQLFNFENGALGSNIRAKSFYSDTRYNDYSQSYMKTKIVINSSCNTAVLLAYNNFLCVLCLSVHDKITDHGLDSYVDYFIPGKDPKSLKEEEFFFTSTGKIEIKKGETKENIDDGADVEFEMKDSCFIANLEKFGIGAYTSIKDFAFLKNTGPEEILAVLHSSRQKSHPGRLLINSYTFELDFFSVLNNDLVLLKRVNNLPFNCTKIVCTTSLSVCVATPSSLLVLSMLEGKNTAVLTTHHPEVETIDSRLYNKFIRITNTELRFDHAQFEFLDKFNMLIAVLKHGQVALIDLTNAFYHLNNFSEESIEITIIGASVSPTHLTLIESKSETYLFIGSNLGDSLLVKLNFEFTLQDEYAEQELLPPSCRVLAENKRKSVLQSLLESCRVNSQRLAAVEMTVIDFLPSSAPTTTFDVCSYFCVKGVSKEVIEGGNHLFQSLEAQNKHTVAANFNRTLTALKKALEGGSLSDLQNVTVTEHLRINLALDFFMRNEHSFEVIVSSYGRGKNGGIEIFEPSGIKLALDFDSQLKLQTKQEVGIDNINFLNTFFEDAPSKLYQAFIENIEYIQLLCIDHSTLLLSNNRESIVIKNLKEFQKVPVCSYHTGISLHICQLSTKFIMQVCPKFVCFLLNSDIVQLISTIRYPNISTVTRAIKAIYHEKLLFVLFDSGTLVVYEVDINKLSQIKVFYDVMNFTFRKACLVTVVLNSERQTYNLVFFSKDLTCEEHISESCILSGEWVIKMVNSKRRLSKMSPSLNPGTEFRLSVFLCEISIFDFGIEVCILRMNTGQILIYHMIKNSSRNHYILNRVPYDIPTVAQKELPLEQLFLEKFLFFDEFSGHRILVIYQGFHKKPLLVTSSRKRVVITNLDLINAMSMVRNGKKLVFLNDRGRVFETAMFQNKFMNFRSLSTKVPLGTSISKVVSVSSLPLFAAVTSVDETEEEVDCSVRTQESLTLLNLSSLFEKNNCGGKQHIIAHNFSLLRHERGLCLERLALKCPDMSDLIVLGTGFVSPGAEDASCKGRILLFSLNAEENKLKRRFVVDNPKMRGPVSAVSSVCGKLLCSLGTCPSQIRVFKYSQHQVLFTPLTFIDVPFYTTDLQVVYDHKSLILATDIYESSHLIYWYDYKSTFELFVKSTTHAFKFRKREVAGKPLLVKDKGGKTRVLVVTGDSQGCVRIKRFNFKESRQRLLDCADISFRDEIFCIKVFQGNQVIFGFKNGGICRMTLIFNDYVKRKLTSLQAALSALEPKNNCGLNCRAFRNSLGRIRKYRNILDGSLLRQYISLPSREQKTIAKLIGYSILELSDI